VRSTANWEIWDSISLGSVSAGLTAALPYAIGLNLGFTTTFGEEDAETGSESYYASLSRNFGAFDLGLVGGYDRTGGDVTEDGFRVALTASFTTFTDPETLETIMTSNRIARRGAIRARAFFDENRNGVRDAGEPLVPNAKVLFAGQRTPYYTGETQAPMSEPVGAGRWVDVALDRSGLPNAELSAGNAGVAVLPRSGVVSDVELPVISTAGIEGYVRLSVDGEARNLPNVKVQVVRRDEGGEETVIAEASTEFDGLFSLSEVPTGTYTVRVDPEQAHQIGVKNAAEHEITLKRDTGVLDGIELELERG
jgi:hypothetical protein